MESQKKEKIQIERNDNSLVELLKLCKGFFFLSMWSFKKHIKSGKIIVFIQKMQEQSKNSKRKKTKKKINKKCISALIGNQIILNIWTVCMLNFKVLNFTQIDVQRINQLLTVTSKHINYYAWRSFNPLLDFSACCWWLNELRSRFRLHSPIHEKRIWHCQSHFVCCMRENLLKQGCDLFGFYCG